MIISQNGEMVKLEIDDIIEVKDGLAIIQRFSNEYAYYMNYPLIEDYIKYASSFTYYDAQRDNITKLCHVSELVEKYPEKLI